MKFLRFSPFVRTRLPFGILAGVLLALSFPRIGIAGLAWAGPGLILASTLGGTGKQAFRVGYFAGLAHYLTSLSWLLHIPYRWLSIPIGPAIGWIALSAFLSLFTATWAWLCVEVRSVNGGVRSTGPLRAAFTSIAEASWVHRALWALFCGAAWVAMEMTIARIFGGFPWNLLGASQYKQIPLIQIASVTAVYGVSFLLAWTSVSLLCAAAVIVHRPTVRSLWIGEVLLPMTAVALTVAFGVHQLNHPPATGRELKLAFIQPSIPQTLIWNRDNDSARLQELVALSEQALTNQADVLFWPEAAIPKLLRYDKETFQTVTNTAGRHHVWMIVGSDDAEPHEGSTDPDDADYYNCSFLVSPEGLLMNRYRKRSLVMFGEYIPLERWLPFIKFLTPWMPGSFASGDKAVPFEMERRPPAPEQEGAAPPEPDAADRFTTCVLICFEDNFPHLVREYSGEDIDFLVNLTNNGWFGESAAQWQHAANAAFRAIENGLPLVRCTNNGLTCWIDASGRLQQTFVDKHGSVYGKGIMTASLPLPPHGERSLPFYTRHGDWFGWSCVLIAGLAMAGTIIRNRRVRKVS